LKWGWKTSGKDTYEGKTVKEGVGHGEQLGADWLKGEEKKDNWCIRGLRNGKLENWGGGSWSNKEFEELGLRFWLG